MNEREQPVSEGERASRSLAYLSACAVRPLKWFARASRVTRPLASAPSTLLNSLRTRFQKLAVATTSSTCKHKQRVCNGRVG
jgi:hypothetical protein